MSDPTHDEVQAALPAGWVLGSCIRPSRRFAHGVVVSGFKAWPDPNDDTKRAYVAVSQKTGPARLYRRVYGKTEKAEALDVVTFDTLADLDDHILSIFKAGGREQLRQKAEREARESARAEEKREQEAERGRQQYETAIRERAEAQSAARERVEALKRERREAAEAQAFNEQNPDWGRF